MSLFENDEYQWRETYFVLMASARRPTGDVLQGALRQLDRRYKITNVRSDETGQFEGLTLVSPDDNAAMDVVYLAGEEVVEQTADLAGELRRGPLEDDQRQLIKRVPECDARFDVFHFEQMDFLSVDEDEEECLDPGALLIVLETLAELCNGIVVDPQSGSLL